MTELSSDDFVPQEEVYPESSSIPLLAMEEQLYRLLVETVRDYAIFVLDPTGHIATWNAGARAIKGYTEEEIVGRHFSTFYPPADIAADKPAWELREAIAHGRFEDEGWRLRKDGTRFWANVIITALHAPDGRLVGFAKVTRDLTERREAEARAIADSRRLAEVEAANRTKMEFLSIMSHELRTPLNAIGGYAELLEVGVRGEVNEGQREFLSRIRGSQQHLLGIVNDLLNFSRIDAGQVVYDLAAVPLAELTATVTPMVEPQAVSKGISLQVRRCPPDVVARVDRAKAEQILLNLLSNAVKFTGSGGDVSLRCHADGDRVVVVVSDTGEGIPADKLVSVFEPFVQLGRSLSSTREGTGLGLSISRELARAMGGDITVESEVGRGSTFMLTFPAA